MSEHQDRSDRKRETSVFHFIEKPLSNNKFSELAGVFRKFDIALF